jgi:predicted dehydrogenase
MEKLNWGIIGTGGIAKKFARALADAERGTLYAVGSRSQARADDFGDEFGAPARYGSYEALLADERVDAVYNALPNHLHLEWTVQAAEAGKHVLCEKPLTVDVGEAHEMVAAVEAADVFMMEAFMYRCHPQTAKLIELIRAGAIGEVRVIQAHFGYDLGGGPEAYENIRLRHDARGGGIMDVGCYTVSMARLIAGAALGQEGPAEPERIEGAAHIGPGGVDEWATGVAYFAGAGHSAIVADLACACRVRLDSQVRVWGAEGQITVPVPWNPEHGLVVLARHGEAPQEIETPARVNSYTLEADAVAQALPARQAPYPCMTWDDSVGNMRALDLWRASVGLVF